MSPKDVDILLCFFFLLLFFLLLISRSPFPTLLPPPPPPPPPPPGETLYPGSKKNFFLEAFFVYQNSKFLRSWWQSHFGSLETVFRALAWFGWKIFFWHKTWRPAAGPQKSDTFSICACHPCAGAMLIFSVSFQFFLVETPRREFH